MALTGRQRPGGGDSGVPLFEGGEGADAEEPGQLGDRALRREREPDPGLGQGRGGADQVELVALQMGSALAAFGEGGGPVRGGQGELDGAHLEALQGGLVAQGPGPLGGRRQLVDETAGRDRGDRLFEVAALVEKAARSEASGGASQVDLFSRQLARPAAQGAEAGSGLGRRGAGDRKLQVCGGARMPEIGSLSEAQLGHQAGWQQAEIEAGAGARVQRNAVDVDGGRGGVAAVQGDHLADTLATRRGNVDVDLEGQRLGQGGGGAGGGESGLG